MPSVEGGQRIVLARLAPGASHVIDWVPLGLSRERYSVYLLYQYKSTNTDAICRESLSPIDVCVDVGNAWGQLLLGSTSTGAFGLLQVSSSKKTKILFFYLSPLECVGSTFARQHQLQRTRAPAGEQFARLRFMFAQFTCLTSCVCTRRCSSDVSICTFVLVKQVN